MALNPEQLEAVIHTEGPLLVIAGAGSGKTTVITQKITHLIQQKEVSPSSILAITFTNKAAAEMKIRIGQALGQVHDLPKVSTFHSFCADVLRQHFATIGGNPRFVISDVGDQRRLVKQIIADLNIDESRYSLGLIQSLIDNAKNKLIDPATFADDPQNDSRIGAIYLEYQKRLWQMGAIDFGDMIVYAVKILTTQPDILAAYQQQFRYILVDEYQDTNHAQFQLIYLLSKTHQNITVVGDFDQNIYSWRGADVRHILEFEVDFPNAKTIKLEQNYRSTQTILNAANAIIVNNTQRKDKNLWTQNNVGEKIKFLNATDENQEGQLIAKMVLEWKTQGIAPNEIAILYRVNALSRPIEEALTMANIPYQVVGGLRFFDRKEIKDMIAYLRLIQNPADDLAFMRICNVPAREIGGKSLGALSEFATEMKLPLFEAAQQLGDRLGTRAIKAITGFVALIQQLRAYHAQLSQDVCAQLIEAVVTQTRYLSAYEKEWQTEVEERHQNINELVGFAREEELELPEFLDKIALISDIDQTDDKEAAITLMTIHHAKGLEFDAVAIAGFEDGVLPHYRGLESEDELEEERRLCYVAITRSRKHLVLSRADRRTLFGELRIHNTSRFFTEIPAECINVALSPAPPATRFAPVGSQNYEHGDHVQHSIWGQGEIMRIDGTGDSAVLHVQFGGELKRLISKYAPLTKLNPLPLK